jgi:NADH-quinone oxidoreductase subunit C
MLIDINSFDYNKNIVLNNKKTNSINCIIYYFFLSQFNIKINFFSFTSEINKINSISNLFNNAFWTERELAEMFNINFLNKLDNRNLLLDYSYIGYPLLKVFPITGNVELYYNFLKNWISYTPVILKESSKIEFFFY